MWKKGESLSHHDRHISNARHTGLPCKFLDTVMPSAMILVAETRPQFHARRPRLCSSLHETKKNEHTPIPRMPPKVRCNPAFWINSSDAEHILYPLYKRGWGIKFQLRPLTTSLINVSHCFYSHNNQNPNRCRIDMLRISWQTLPSPNTVVQSSLSPALIQFVS